MANKARNVVRWAIWLLPASRLKNLTLNRVGDSIADSATARACLVWKVQSIELAAGARLNRWNVIKNMKRVSLGRHASIGRLNLISSHPAFVSLLTDGGVLTLADHAKITSRHQLDCSGGVDIGSYASLAGHQTRVLSHSVDLVRNAQTARPVTVGQRTFVGTRSLLLGGASLPERSVLAAGSVLVPSDEAQPGLYTGVPAKWKAPVSGRWFDREETSTSDVYVPESDETVPGAV